MTFSAPFSRVIARPFGGVPVSGGWWDLDGSLNSCVGAYQAKGAGSYELSKKNLTGDATYDLIDTNHAPSWDASYGWAFPSSRDKYFNTSIIPTGSWSMVIRLSDQVYTSGSSPHIYLGIWTPRFYIAYWVGWVLLTFGNNGYKGTSHSYTGGVLGLLGMAGYEDATKVTGVWDDAIVEHTIPIYIGGGDNNNALYGGCEGKIQAVAIYNTTITETQYLAVRTAMLAL